MPGRSLNWGSWSRGTGTLALLLCGLLAVAAAGEPTWKAGIASTNITPTQPLWMGGYASRTRPAQGKLIDLRLKALALEDATGYRAVIVTSDLLGIPQGVYQHSCAALKQKFGLQPEQILLTASHTHCGPVLREAAMDIYGLEAAQRTRIDAYTAELETKLVDTVARALADLTTARLAAGEGTTSFAVNRRNNPEPEVPNRIELGTLRGPVDHSVPVLAIYLPDGTLKGVLFGYACHNTVMSFYQWSGDYAGFAQLALEKSHPEATAMFFMGCGGDQNPLPRRQLPLAERYGGMLAAAVEEVLRSPLHRLAPELRTSIEMVDLALGNSPTQADLEKIIEDKATSPTARRWATRLLEQIHSGQPLARTYPYPVQAWRLGGQQLLLTLGGEPVVDYALKFKAQFGRQTWVAGYCNDVMAYIPSLRVLQEDRPPLAESTWGYEGARSMMAYGQPAERWSDQVESQIDTAVRKVVARLERRP